jgi:arylsulfatase A-like enzyme
MEELDAEIGRLVEEAERQNTIIVFTSDNGPWILKGLEGGSSGLFTDGKGSTWEGGIRVPMLMRWRGQLAPGVYGTPWATVDLLPTLTQMALGRAVGATDGQAVSLAGVSAEGGDGEERLLLFHGPDNTVTAARWGRWKLHLRLLSQVGGKYTADEPPLLYDLEVDPSESRNVAAQHPDVVAEMRAMVAARSR